MISSSLKFIEHVGKYGSWIDFEFIVEVHRACWKNVILEWKERKGSHKSMTCTHLLSLSHIFMDISVDFFPRIFPSFSISLCRYTRSPTSPLGFIWLTLDPFLYRKSRNAIAEYRRCKPLETFSIELFALECTKSDEDFKSYYRHRRRAYFEYC